jgi:disulfide bond formation protein DsbB
MISLRQLAQAGGSRGYWLLLLLVAFAMEGVALLYQYQWDYAPCVLCIHVRIWFLGMIAAAVMALALRPSRYAIAAMHGLMALLMGGLLERSYQLLATERAWIFGSCNMDAGLPDWFALDRWFPAVFEVQTSCGYTPELLFGITMAEALLLFSVFMVLLAAGLMVVSLLLARES